MAPSTASVMAALPSSKAGLGSALNDTSREVGAALGIAVLGSVTSFIYRADLGDALAGAPNDVAETVKSSAGAGLAIAREIGGIGGSALHDAIAYGFSHGVAVAFAFAAVIVAVAALAVWSSTQAEAPTANTGRRIDTNEMLDEGSRSQRERRW